jgi:hypothetical protein
MAARMNARRQLRKPMSGRARLPSGEPRRASQRHARRATQAPVAIESSWCPGDKVRWQGYTGSYLRDAVDGQAEVLIGARTYLVWKIELQSAFMRKVLPRIPQIDWAGRTEGRGNAGQTADSFFHPSGPSGFRHLIPPKSLIKLPKLTHGAGRTPFHPGNPGLLRFIIKRGEWRI